MHRVADRFLSRFTRPYVDGVLRARGRVTDEDVERSLALGVPSGSLVDVFVDVQVAKQVDPAAASQRVYSELVSATVLDMVEFVERDMGLPAARVAGTFNVTNPQVLRAAETLTADLIRQVSDESKTAVRRIITDSIRDGVPPREAAKTIRQIVGLTERQALQVSNFRRGLVDAGRKPQDVDRLSGRLSDRLLRERSMNIARTETIRASNRGQQLAWQEMVNQGVLAPDFQQRWLVTPDDRLCPRCAPLQGKTVQLGFLFRETERGVLPSARVPVAGDTVESPPLHPRCRCVLVAQVSDVDRPRVPEVRRPDPGAEGAIRPRVPEPAPTTGPFSDDMFTALFPQRGGWTTKTRAETLKAIRAEGPDGRLLADTMSRFQNSGNINRMRTSVETHLAGGNSPQGRVLVDAIRGAPSDRVPSVLHRGLSVRGTPEELLARNQVGGTFDMNISSFSTDRKISKGFAEATQKKGMTQIMMRVEDTQSALPIENFAPSRVFAQEKEWVTGGRFEIVSSKVRGGVVELVVRQVATL